MAVDVLLGLQWGDEGKGKIVDVLTSNYDIIARFQGGPNAGHTLEFDGIKHVLHTIPSGIFHPTAMNVLSALLNLRLNWAAPTCLMGCPYKPMITIEVHTRLVEVAMHQEDASNVHEGQAG